MELYFPINPFLNAMEMTQEEFASGIVAHSLHGLHRRWMIGEGYALGSLKSLDMDWASDDDIGLVVHPSAFGATLFMWAHGRGAQNTNYFTQSSVQFDTDVQVPPMTGVRATKKSAE
jgi:hypothetical protein